MKLTDHIKNKITLLDGGMGTLLQAKGLRAPETPEEWNITHPEIIREIHTAYFDAGSNIVATNTFGANILKMDELSYRVAPWCCTIFSTVFCRISALVALQFLRCNPSLRR